MSENNQEESGSTNTAKSGAFLDSLKRNNRQIHEDRATAIAEDAQLLYRRKVEDLELQITRLRRDQENMLDLSPDTAHSLKLASDFKGNEYVQKDLEISENIRNLEIQLELARAQYALGTLTCLAVSIGKRSIQERSSY